MQVSFYMYTYSYVYMFLKQEKPEMDAFESKKNLVLTEKYLYIYPRSPYLSFYLAA